MIKRLFLAWALLFAGVVATTQAQFFTPPINIVSTASGACSDSDATAWAAQAVTNGGTVSAGRATLVCQFIAGLKTDSIWTKFDRLWLLAAENAISALTDLKGLTLATATGSPTFNANLGYTGVDSSTTVYIETGANLSTLGGNFSTNAGHVSVWSNTNTTAGVSGGNLFGVSGGVNNLTQIFPKYNDGNAYFRINDNIASSGIANADSTGHYLANRSDGTHTQAYKNGSSIGNPNASAGTLQNSNMAILAGRASGISFGSACQTPMASIGGTLSSTDVTNFYNRLRTYMTAVGVP